MRAESFVPLTDPAGVATLLERSHEGPLVLFLHDDFCPISGRAYAEMTALRQRPEGETETSLVDVRHDRAVSREIESLTGVRHESPQTIVLRNGRAVWDASHFAITAEAVAGAIAANR